MLIICLLIGCGSFITPLELMGYWCMPFWFLKLFLLKSVFFSGGFRTLQGRYKCCPSAKWGWTHLWDYLRRFQNQMRFQWKRPG